MARVPVLRGSEAMELDAELSGNLWRIYQFAEPLCVRAPCGDADPTRSKRSHDELLVARADPVPRESE